MIKINLKQQLTSHLFQLLLKQMNTLSNNIQVESLLKDVESILTMEFLLSDMGLKEMRIISLLRTLGVLHGEIKDMSKYRNGIIFVASSQYLHIQPNDLYKFFM